MSDRKTVHPEALRTIINEELARHPETAGVRVGLPTRLMPDETGCNWEGGNFQIESNTRFEFSDAFKRKAHSIINEIAGLYNLEDE